MELRFVDLIQRNKISAAILDCRTLRFATLLPQSFISCIHIQRIAPSTYTLQSLEIWCCDIYPPNAKKEKVLAAIVLSFFSSTNISSYLAMHCMYVLYSREAKQHLCRTSPGTHLEAQPCRASCMARRDPGTSLCGSTTSLPGGAVGRCRL